MNDEKGFCPVCGDNLNYDTDPEFKGDDQFCFAWSCPCGQVGEEYYEYQFTGHEYK